MNISSPDRAFRRIFAATPGAMLCLLLSGLALALAQLPGMALVGMGALPLALLLGMLAGNVGGRFVSRATPGVLLVRGPWLRAGIALYGLRLSAEGVMAVGWQGAVMALAVVASTMLLALWLGRSLLGLDRSSCLLIGAGSAICGAAAVAAADSVLRAPARQVSAAVAAVVVFGSLAMFLVPIAYPVIGLGAEHFGQFLGLTVHELGQVIAAANGLGEQATSAALVEKMLRVLLLAPAVIAIACLAGSKSDCGVARPRGIPLFVWGFVLALTLNLAGLLPPTLHAIGEALAQGLLACGLCALGAMTRWRDVQQAGLRAWALAAMLWGWLLVAGYVLVRTLAGGAS